MPKNVPGRNLRLLLGHATWAGIVVREAESVTVRGKTRIPAKNRETPEMTVPISLK